MRMLVSVRDVAEAQEALRAGVDFIDLKEPAAGALGGLALPVIREVVAALRAGEGAGALVSSSAEDAWALAVRGAAGVIERADQAATRTAQAGAPAHAPMISAAGCPPETMMRSTPPTSVATSSSFVIVAITARIAVRLAMFSR